MTASGEAFPFSPANMPQFSPHRVEMPLDDPAATDARVVTQLPQEQQLSPVLAETAKHSLLTEAEARLLKQVRRALGGGNPDMAGRKPLRHRRTHYK